MFEKLLTNDTVYNIIIKDERMFIDMEVFIIG